MTSAEARSTEAGTDRVGPIRVFLLDDHEIVRRGVRELVELEGDITVVGEAGSVAEALARIPGARADVAVLDVQLADGSGIEVCREVRSSHPEVACLMLTSFSDDEAMLDSVVAGAAGYVLKQIRGNELVAGIRAAAAGGSLMDPAMAARAVERLRRGPAEDPRIASLTEQERKVLLLLSDGLTNREIGERLFLAEKTVKNYVSNLLMKMGMKRRTEAAVYAARHQR
ncbi:response regulator transcription factor [Aquihabitans sp. G128]|uniref:response regulator n=1 Tax=Aquihabitans sp. G128 TaxID=2849779 RepID=UPI002738DD1E|nr:response regulator transcription factor [Aquihabitans sp. G128]